MREILLSKDTSLDNISTPVNTGRADSACQRTTVGLLTGGQDRPYAFGLAMALTAAGIRLEVVGSDEVDSPEMHQTANLRFMNIKSDWRGMRQSAKAWKLLVNYAKLVGYTAFTQAPVLHILWNNRLELFDRTLFMVYLKALGKKVVITAHNVNAGRRDANDNWLNRATLKCQYRLCDHIFVHTRKMKDELCAEFGVKETAVTVLRHPVNDAFPDTELTPADAKSALGIRDGEKVMLFFGRIRPYKGLEYLLQAFEQIASKDDAYRLLIAGESKKGSENYFSEIQQRIEASPYKDRILQKIEFIPDEDAEIYLKAADVMVLPYRDIFQSGVLFLSYSFGLPAIVADVGSFAEEVIEGQTGFVCQPCDPNDLARAIERYFASDLYRNLKTERGRLRDYAFEQHSWKAVGELTGAVYVGLAKD